VFYGRLPAPCVLYQTLILSFFFSLSFAKRTLEAFIFERKLVTRYAWLASVSFSLPPPLLFCIFEAVILKDVEIEARRYSIRVYRKISLARVFRCFVRCTYRASRNGNRRDSTTHREASKRNHARVLASRRARLLIPTKHCFALDSTRAFSLRNRSAPRWIAAHSTRSIRIQPDERSETTLVTRVLESAAKRTKR